MHKDLAATGETIIKLAPLLTNLSALPPAAPPHVNLAAARAWMALGEKFLEVGDADGAVYCAQDGLRELGNDYCPDSVCDDTTLKLGAANDLIQDDRVVDGARLMLKMLKIRSELYVQLHHDMIIS